MKNLILLLLICPIQLFAGVVADTIFMECRGESAQGRHAVASVIWNRHMANRKSLSAVCKAPAQFSCWSGRANSPKPCNNAERKILAEALDWELQMMHGSFQPSVKARHYYAGKKPYWAKKMKVEKIIDHHTFMLEK